MNLKDFDGWTITRDGKIFDENNKEVRPYIDAYGKKYIKVNKVNKYIAVLVLQYFQNRRPKKGEAVKYRDNNPENCALDNLYIGYTENKYAQPIKKTKRYTQDQLYV